MGATSTRQAANWTAIGNSLNKASRVPLPGKSGRSRYLLDPLSMRNLRDFLGLLNRRKVGRGWVSMLRLLLLVLSPHVLGSVVLFVYNGAPLTTLDRRGEGTRSKDQGEGRSWLVCGTSQPRRSGLGRRKASETLQPSDRAGREIFRERVCAQDRSRPKGVGEQEESWFCCKHAR